MTLAVRPPTWRTAVRPRLSSHASSPIPARGCPRRRARAVRLPRNPSATVTMTVMPSPRYTTLAAPGVKLLSRTGRPTAAETSPALSRTPGGGAPAPSSRWANRAPGGAAPTAVLARQGGAARPVLAQHGDAARPVLARHQAEELARPRRGPDRHRVPQRQLAERLPADVEAPGPLAVVHGDAGDGVVVVVGAGVLHPAGDHLGLEACFGRPGQPGGQAARATDGRRGGAHCQPGRHQQADRARQQRADIGHQGEPGGQHQPERRVNPHEGRRADPHQAPLPAQG